MKHGTADRLEQLYELLAAERPGGTALSFVSADGARRTLSWAEVLDLARSRAAELTDSGVATGDLVAIESAGTADCIAAYVATWLVGAAVVPVDPQWGGWLRDGVVRQSGAAVVVTATDETWAIAPAGSERRGSVPRECAIVSYTSGSTGDPKGVVLHHAHLLHAYRAGATELSRITGRLPRRIACAMRVSALGVVGIHYLWAAVLGAEVVTVPELTLRTAPDYWARLVAEGAEATYLVPPLIAVLNRVGVRPDGDEPLPVCMTGGAPLSPELQRRFQERFGATLLNFYGLTEVGFTAFFGSVDEVGRGRPDIGSSGIVLARLRSTAASKLVLDAEGEGELEVTGPSLAAGYLGNDAAWSEVVHDGWLRTGDIARRSTDGSYTIVGRSKDVVNRGGFAIYLNEVEAAALELPGVIEAGALRLVLAEELEDIGLVVRSDTLDERAVRDAVQDMVGASRAPRRVVVVPDALPRVSQGKLDRAALRRLWDEHVAPISDSGGG